MKGRYVHKKNEKIAKPTHKTCSAGGFWDELDCLYISFIQIL